MSVIFDEVIRLLEQEDGWTEVEVPLVNETVSSRLRLAPDVDIDIDHFIIRKPLYTPGLFQTRRLRKAVEHRQLTILRASREKRNPKDKE